MIRRLVAWLRRVDGRLSDRALDETHIPFDRSASVSSPTEGDA